MPQTIYNKHTRRSVREPTGFESDLIVSIRPLSTICKEGVFLLEEELESNDPDINERCGLLNDRYEVYSVKIPGCKGHYLGISIDLKSSKPPPVTIHGAVGAHKACTNVRNLVTRQLKLINPSWE